MMGWIAKLDCNNPSCILRGPIFLPYPKHLGASVDQPNWPKDGWSTFAMCQLCGHAYMYTKADVRWGIADDSGLWQQNMPLRLSLLCDRVDCESQIEAYAFWSVPAMQADIQRKIVYGSGAPTCKNQHALRQPISIVDSEGISR
jgi:hypothetical protein